MLAEKLSDRLSVSCNSASALAELHDTDNLSDNFSASTLAEKSSVVTFKVPFTHHIRIIEGTKERFFLQMRR